MFTGCREVADVPTPWTSNLNAQQLVSCQTHEPWSNHAFGYTIIPPAMARDCSGKHNSAPSDLHIYDANVNAQGKPNYSWSLAVVMHTRVHKNYMHQLNAKRAHTAICRG